MKKWRWLIHPVLVFTLAQIAWFSLLALWIYWYVSNYIIFNKVGDKVSPQIISKNINIFALVFGIVLLVTILVGIYLIFFFLNKQLNYTKLYDNFIANVTHELKSPLASIQLYLETLKTRNVPKEKSVEFLDVMIQDTNRLKTLINSILELTRLEKKKIAYNFHVYEADQTIKAILADSQEQFKLSKKDMEIKGLLTGQCVCDQNSLKIVFNNLVDNAKKYSVESPQINVNLQQNSKNFKIIFTDQGIGIEKKQQKNVFRKFHRIYNSHIPNVKGTGLGLYWVKEIIKFHGGKITVYSEGLYKGTTFILELPIYRLSKQRHINNLLEITRKWIKQRANEDVK